MTEGLEGVLYNSRGGYWNARGYPSIALPDRGLLVPGTYIPGTQEDAALISGINTNSVGVLNESLLTNVVEAPASRVYTIDNSTPSSFFQNTHYKTAVSVGSGLSGPRTFINCRFSSNNPDDLFRLFSETGSVSSGQGSGFRNWSSRHITFIDCEFDVGWWQANGLSGYAAWQHSAGLSGGHYTLLRCLVRGFTDGWNMTGAPGNAALDQYILIDSCRIGPNYFARNIPAIYGPQSGAYTHSDGFQCNTGGNIEIRHSYIGGPRLASANSDFPGGTDQRDCANAGLMLQQEPDSRYPEERIRVDGIYVHDNWIAGGSSAVNLNYAQGNTLPSPELAPAGWVGNRVVDNRFLRRTNGFNDSGYQIRYRTEMKTDVSRNTTWDADGSIAGTGTPITVHEVANSGSGDTVVGTWPSPS